MYYLFTNILFIIVQLNALLHPCHLSVTNIDFDETGKAFTISSKIFRDDFEKIVSQKYNVALNLTENKDSLEVNKFIIRYISDNLKIIINNKDKSGSELMFLEKKISSESVWLYFKMKEDNPVTTVFIQNSILQDLYPDQKNLVIFKYKDIQKGFEMDKKNNTVSIQI